MARSFVAIFAIALALAGAALAAASGMTPAQMQNELLSPSTSFYNATQFGGSEYGLHLPAGNLTNPTCHGLGKPAKGTYLVFSCSETFHDAAGTSNVVMWVRPYSSTVLCQTKISVGACPPAPPAHPLSGDPRVCGAPAFAYSYCVYGAARAASQAKLRSENLIGVNYGCVATTAFVYRCAGSGVGANAATNLTVTFVQGKKSWTTKVA